MKSAVLVFVICQVSAIILDETKKAQISNLENKSKSMSPKEKIKCEQKIRISKIFGIFLKYGSMVYLILSIILEVLNTIN